MYMTCYYVGMWVIEIITLGTYVIIQGGGEVRERGRSKMESLCLVPDHFVSCFHGDWWFNDLECILEMPVID